MSGDGFGGKVGWEALAYLEGDEDDVGFAAETDGYGALLNGFGGVLYLENAPLWGAEVG